MVDKYVAPKSKATARVVMTVEVDCDGSWGGNCQIDQVHDQAAKSAFSILTQAAGSHRKIKLVKIDEVKSIVVSSKPRSQ